MIKLHPIPRHQSAHIDDMTETLNHRVPSSLQEAGIATPPSAYYISNFVTVAEEERLLDKVGSWST